MREPAGRVCVVGSVNIDTTYLVPAIPRPGETILAGGKSVAPGGKGANQAAAAAAMGSLVTFVGCVGDDPEADLAIDSLRQHGVDVSEVGRVRGTATGTAAIFVSDGGENVIVVDAGANRRLGPDVVGAHLDRAAYDVVLAQLEIDIRAVRAAANGARGARFILNPAPIPDDVEQLRELLPRTNVLVLNRPELARLAGTPFPATRGELGPCVAALGFNGTLMVTLGSEGVVVYDGDHGSRVVTWIEPVIVDTVDTTGAGDAFCGVLAHELAAGRSVIEAARRANTMAAFSTTVGGARVSAALFRAGDPPRVSGVPARPS